mmetsp:Transcript_129472/g.374983  ORF Transcript_129472/g.374983 Transcript_129472/m.374983 type:complete len:371 (-) Transcript_129472:512-1624(-)
MWMGRHSMGRTKRQQGSQRPDSRRNSTRRSRFSRQARHNVLCKILHATRSASSPAALHSRANSSTAWTAMASDTSGKRCGKTKGLSCGSARPHRITSRKTSARELFKPRGSSSNDSSWMPQTARSGSTACKNAASTAGRQPPVVQKASTSVSGPSLAGACSAPRRMSSAWPSRITASTVRVMWTLPRMTARCSSDTRSSGPLQLTSDASSSPSPPQLLTKALPGKSAMARRRMGSAPYDTKARTTPGEARATASASGVHSEPSPRRSVAFATARPRAWRSSRTRASLPEKMANMSGVQRCRAVVAFTAMPRLSRKLTVRRCPPSAARWIAKRPLSSHWTPRSSRPGSALATQGPPLSRAQANPKTSAEPT